MPRALSVLGSVLDVVLPVSGSATTATATAPSAANTPAYQQPPRPPPPTQQQQQQQQQHSYPYGQPPQHQYAYGQPPPAYTPQIPPQHADPFQDARLPAPPQRPPPPPVSAGGMPYPQPPPQQPLSPPQSQAQQPLGYPTSPPPQAKYTDQQQASPAVFRLLFVVLWHADFARWASVSVSRQMPQPSDDPADCCDWTVCDACEKSLQWNLLCPCVCLGDIAARIALAVFGGAVYAIAMLLVQVLHTPIDAFLLVKSIVVASPQFGLLLKLLLLLWGLVGIAVSLPVVFVTSLCLGTVIAFGWPLSFGVSIMAKSVGVALVDGVGYKARELRTYEEEGPYMRLKLLRAILAFVFMFVGMVLCALGFFAKTAIDVPANAYRAVAELWRDACVGIAPSRERRPAGPLDDLPCCALLNCLEGATAQLCSLLLIPFRFVASVFVVVCILVAPAIALLLGLFAGVPAGARVYDDPGSALTLAHIRDRVHNFRFFSLCAGQSAYVSISSDTTRTYQVLS